METRSNNGKSRKNNNITQNVENENSCIIYMDRGGDVLLPRQYIVIAYAHAHKTAIR